MKHKRIATIMVVGILLAWSAPNAMGQAAGNLILQVPDWNQPSNYGVGGYLNWCSPTAGGNLMGYWEDVMGCTGLTDRQVEPAGPAYANNANTYMQGLFNDGQIEMGFYMGTQGWANPLTQLPPNTVFGTPLPQINPGLMAYATTAWVDPGATAIAKVAYPNTTVVTDPLGTPFATMWANYTTEIDANRPVECTFLHWVDDANQTGTTTIIGFPAQTIEFYPWDLGVDPHSVVGVGYIDPVAGYDGDGTEFFVCQDGWPGPHVPVVGGTGQYVAVPLDSFWLQNDYVTNVPEPFTMTLLLIGGAGLFLRRKR
ncbi:MAG: PEP-CTERM sorting domain-containing protein [Phycisphaerae bacterium]|nr:PEP-CTERM sorting domain-containing protein [Phycisphaerae bacterium]